MTNKHATTFQGSIVELSGQDEDRVQTRDAEQTLRSIMDGLDATVLAVSDEEIIAELRKQGRDPMKEAEEVRKILIEAIRKVESEASNPSPESKDTAHSASS